MSNGGFGEVVVLDGVSLAGRAGSAAQYLKYRLYILLIHGIKLGSGESHGLGELRDLLLGDSLRV